LRKNGTFQVAVQIQSWWFQVWSSCWVY